MGQSETYEGGCLCGAIRFQAVGRPMNVGWCHCTSCRKQTGAPAACYVDNERDRVAFVKGRPIYYQSSPKAIRGFCAGCGSTLSFEDSAAPDGLSVHIGAFDDPGLFKPLTSSHSGERLPWVEARVTDSPPAS